MNIQSRKFATKGALRALVLAIPLIGGCAATDVTDYAQAEPAFDLPEFFDGRVQAWGIVQNWRGHVTRRFTCTIDGTHADGVLTLNEQFEYADGERSTRRWEIRTLPNGRVEGEANDVLGTAVGRLSGNAMRWRYSMDLPVENTTYRVNFDDWMWRLDDRTLVNRTDIVKFGVTVGEVTIFMRKDGA